MVEKGYDLKSGARHLSRAIRRYVEDPLAEAIVDGLPYEACSIYVRVDPGGGKLVFRYKERIVVRPVPKPGPAKPPPKPGTDMVFKPAGPKG